MIRSIAFPATFTRRQPGANYRPASIHRKRVDSDPLNDPGFRPMWVTDQSGNSLPNCRRALSLLARLAMAVTLNRSLIASHLDAHESRAHRAPTNAFYRVSLLARDCLLPSIVTRYVLSLRAHLEVCTWQKLHQPCKRIMVRKGGLWTLLKPWPFSIFKNFYSTLCFSCCTGDT